MAEKLIQKDYKLAVAESCTGGLIGHRITNIPGSSEYYLGSITAYAYEVKERLLGVHHETLATYGAVSPETVLEMARGIRSSLAADFPWKRPLGFPSAVSLAQAEVCQETGRPGLDRIEHSAWRLGLEYQWSGNRIENKDYSAQAALQRLMDYLNGQVIPED